MEEQKFNGDFVVGDEYETRGNGRATYLGKNPYPNDDSRNYCWGYKDGQFETAENGRFWRDYEGAFDIIRHMKPKKKVVGYVNVYGPGNVCFQFSRVHLSRDEAEEYREKDPIACIKVKFEYEEGQFDD